MDDLERGNTHTHTLCLAVSCRLACILPRGDLMAPCHELHCTLLGPELYLLVSWPIPCCELCCLYPAVSWPVHYHSLDCTLSWFALNLAVIWSEPELISTLTQVSLYLAVSCTDLCRGFTWTLLLTVFEPRSEVTCTLPWADLNIAVSWNISCRGPFCIMPWLIPNYQAMRRTLP